MLVCGDREAMVMAPPPTCNSAVSPRFHGCLAFLHRDFPPQSSPLYPLDSSLCSQQLPSPWDCSQSLDSSSQPLWVLGDLHPCPGCISLWQGLSDAHSIWLLQICCFILSLKCFSSDSDNCPDVGIGTLLQFSHPLRAGPVLPTLLFFPLVSSSYWVLLGSMYSLLLVRYSCLFSVGVVHALLCLKVYSWCIRVERCIPHTPTTPHVVYWVFKYISDITQWLELYVEITHNPHLYLVFSFLRLQFML